ncbi:MAG: MmcQ/YjbR family DNA-binding protein [Chitinophagaceae bacterium]|nr:MmcQ/YjbR family DNA-binding protein [Chitinophagaceae bacterium]
MHLEQFRQYCLSLPATEETLPFDEDTLVFKVAGKMFALANMTVFESINLKCDPEQAIELRERYAAVLPGYHMNKQHWNTVLIDGSIPNQLLLQWTKDSYDLVVQSLPKKLRAMHGL